MKVNDVDFVIANLTEGDCKERKNMKGQILIIFSFLIILFGCNKRNENIQANISGNYIGSFERNGIKSKVELNFDNGMFHGESKFSKFPALCRGTYKTSGNTITFTNTCAWTLEFDWTLILSGDWNINLNDNLLILTKSNGDNYTLKRK